MAFVDGERVYEVEKILGKKIENGQALYKTKWKGYDKEEDITDEPYESFKLCPSVIVEFEAKEALARGIQTDLIQELEKLPIDKMKRRDQDNSHKAQKKDRL